MPPYTDIDISGPRKRFRAWILAMRFMRALQMARQYHLMVIRLRPTIALSAAKLKPLATELSTWQGVLNAKRGLLRLGDLMKTWEAYRADLPRFRAMPERAATSRLGSLETSRCSWRPNSGVGAHRSPLQHEGNRPYRERRFRDKQQSDSA